MDLNRKQETFHESPQKHFCQSTYPRWLWPVPPASWAPWWNSVPGEGHWPQMAEKRRERYPLAFQYLFKIKHNWLKTNNCFITLQRRKGLVTFPLVLVMKTRQELPDIPIVQWCVMSVKIFLTVRRPRFEAWRISQSYNNYWLTQAAELSHNLPKHYWDVVQTLGFRQRSASYHRQPQEGSPRARDILLSLFSVQTGQECDCHVEIHPLSNWGSTTSCCIIL